MSNSLLILLLHVIQDSAIAQSVLIWEDGSSGGSVGALERALKEDPDCVMANALKLGGEIMSKSEY